jgi:hypothetical protein
MRFLRRQRPEQQRSREAEVERPRPAPLPSRDVDVARLAQPGSFLRQPSTRLDLPDVAPVRAVARPREETGDLPREATTAREAEPTRQTSESLVVIPSSGAEIAPPVPEPIRPVTAASLARLDTALGLAPPPGPELPAMEAGLVPLPLPPPIRVPEARDVRPTETPAPFDRLALANHLAREADRETSQRGAQDEARLSAAFGKHVEPLFRGPAPAADRPDGLTGQERDGLRTVARIAARAVGRDVLAGLAMETMARSPAPFEVQIDATEIRDEENFRAIVGRIARTNPTVQARLNNGAVEPIGKNADAFVDFALHNRETLTVLFPRVGDRVADAATAKTAVELAENSGGTLLCRVDDANQPVIAPRAIRAELEEVLVSITDANSTPTRDNARDKLQATVRTLRALEPTGEIAPVSRALIAAATPDDQGRVFMSERAGSPIAAGFCRLYELGIPLERSP